MSEAFVIHVLSDNMYAVVKIVDGAPPGTLQVIAKMPDLGRAAEYAACENKQPQPGAACRAESTMRPDANGEEIRAAPCLPTEQEQILAALKKCAAPNGMVRMTAKLITDATGVPRGSVFKALSVLREKRVISQEQRGGSGRPSVYRISA